ncbi:hypothetical protein N657DRAFT_658028 [Parathielavia appendiculata]|uniref:Uncharacterized protein n=1 Tax=Parathielavia appendiculata TaxID=2587402 RepID=A0AAN6TUN7_9PEZI|nr:hypothetical protein N657DRAFT_658028 [Parathielavia appendiculata]
MIDAQELRRRWTDHPRPGIVFHPRDDRHEYREYAPEPYEREFHFRGCRSIVFLRGERTGTEEDVILMTQGSGHMALPAGVQVLVQSGYAKWEPAASAGGSGSTVVGGMGTSGGSRAPPPSRVSSYARSSTGYSAYSPSAAGRSNTQGYVPGPPRGSSYMSACNVPLPPSDVGGRSTVGSGDWEVVEQMSSYGSRSTRDDACSIAPSESISSVGSRGGASQFSRRYTRGY